VCDHLNSDLAVPSRTSHSTLKAALGDDTIDTSSARSDVLPNDLAVVAETELLLAVAHDGTVAGASASSAASTRGRWRRATASGGR
jgi:hypothetical protein